MTIPESRPWWLEEAPPDAPTPPLSGERTADVAIVGGGYTGLWTALALLRRDPDLRVAVVEAKFVGHGPSGRNGGFLHGWWSSLPSLRDV
ncbi:MAG: FAD-binding oxidoreductase, partial [Actinomycetota bacterium]|nr:FAD-binding oxidoreductase [Actinomycetota bacterium]